MKTLIAVLVLVGAAAPAFADPDADARAALALALATNKRTAELERRVAALEARTAPRVGHADVPDVMAPNGFWIRPGSAGPRLATPATSYVAPTITYAQAYAKAKAGKQIILAIGEPPLDPVNFYGAPVYVVSDAPAGTVPGHYQFGPDENGAVVWWTSGWRTQTPAPVRGVVASTPFVAGATWATTPLTYALPAAGASTSRSVSWGITRTRTAAPLMGLSGGITTVSGGCVNGQCGAPARGLFGFGLFR